MDASTSPTNVRQRWLPASAARDLVWWDAPGLAQLCADLTQAARAWGLAWGMDTAGLRAVAEPALALPDIEPGSTTLCCRGAQVGWATGEDAARAALLRSLFAELPSTVDLATHVTAECHADALQRLAVVLGAEVGQEPPATPFPSSGVRTGSGALRVGFEGAPIAGLLLSGAATQVWRARRALATAPRTAQRGEALCAPATAIGERPVAMHAEIAGCELELGTLQALQVGDVLRLRHPLRDPATVSDTSGTPLFCGHLGQLRGAMALELIALQP